MLCRHTRCGSARQEQPRRIERIHGGWVDEVKTEYSRDDVPLDPRLAEVLLAWRSLSCFSRDLDWVFANPDTGKLFHQESLQKRPIKNATKLAGLGEGIGWHTFRPHLPLLTGRDRRSHEGAAGTDASCLDPDDDERLWTAMAETKRPCKQSGCWTGARPQLAGIGRAKL